MEQFSLRIWFSMVLLYMVFSIHGCVDSSKLDKSDTDEIILPETFLPNAFKAPRYFSVYEHHITRLDQSDNFLSEADFLRYAQWVQTQWLQEGISMVALDGWGDVDRVNAFGYRTHHSRHWENDFAWWTAKLKSMGLNLGMYDNPLWVHDAALAQGARVVGTNIPVSSLVDQENQELWFNWVNPSKEGAEAYVKGYVAHYARMGIRYLRVDFLSWFEDGYDKHLGTTGPKRSQEDYILAMKWIREACDDHGVFFSAVMPTLNDEALVERHFAHMIRVNEDVGDGGWERFSELHRGVRRPYWSQFANTFDGFIYWSQYSSRGGLILDGDFIRLNTMSNDAEKRSVITLHTFAGGALSIADRPESIRLNSNFYRNPILNRLSIEGFIAKPLSYQPNEQASQIWLGQDQQGQFYVALFNREDTVLSHKFDLFALTGIESGRLISIWDDEQIEINSGMNSISLDIEPHDVKAYSIFSE